jgi:hypothetical protein
MPWGAVVAAAVSAVSEAQKSGGYDRACLAITHRPAYEPELARALREHQVRMAAETAKTLRDAQIGTYILLALLVTVAIGIGQLCGVIPVI